MNMNRPYSEEPACQRCIREGLCSSDGDTEDRDMLERLRYWILLPDSWVTFRLSRGMRQRWISQSSALLSSAPPTGLRINAPFYPSAERSTQVQHGSTQEKKSYTSTSGYSHMWTWAIRGESYELAWYKSSSSCSFALHQLQRGAWHVVEPGSIRTVQERGQCTHTVNCTLFSPMPCFPLHTSVELFINLCSMTGPGPMLMHWIPMRIVLTLRLWACSLLLWCLWAEFTISHCLSVAVRWKLQITVSSGSLANSPQNHLVSLGDMR